MIETKICLNMIVAGGDDIVIRCLNNMKGVFDCVVIQVNYKDTITDLAGKIQEWICVNNVKGIVLTEKWENFSVNRNLALEFGYEYLKDSEDTWYFMFMDADDLCFPKGDEHIFSDMCYYLKSERDTVFSEKWILSSEEKNKLTADIIYITTKSGVDVEFSTVFMVKVDKVRRFRWFCPVHEIIIPNFQATIQKLDSGWKNSRRESSRNIIKGKFISDAEILLKSLDDPGEPLKDRMTFYLAESYFGARMLDQALKYYQLRLSMGGWDEELYYSAYQIAKIYYITKSSVNIVKDYILKAQSIIPGRLDALGWFITTFKDSSLISECCVPNILHNSTLFVSSKYTQAVTSLL